jgi:aminopeptidase N
LTERSHSTDRNGQAAEFIEKEMCRMRTRLIHIVIVAIIIAVVFTPAVSSTVLDQFEKHDISVVFDVPNQQATISDKGTVQVNDGWNLFYLNESAMIDSLKIDGNPVDYHVVNYADSAQIPVDVKPEMPKLDVQGNPLMVFFESKQTASVPFEIGFTAKFDDSVANVQFSRESVGNEVKGTIQEQGAYLSPAAYFYPVGDEKLARFRVTVDVPDGWLSVSDGNPGSSVVRNGRRVEMFENPYDNDGLTVMAAQFVARLERRDSVEVATYFFEADTALAGGYLEAAAGYIKMYSDLIGPYPFKRFTIAENFFPTGYGFPAWTLLGQQVLKLPFIKATSLGHEVLHNWWGNSVYVNYEKGNWCEGLTVYGADYRYKLLESEQAARDYRKDILKEYASYVNQGNDFPLFEFKSRTSAETRAIGYNKAMMVFHMIEQRIGTKAFFDAWKWTYSLFRARQVDWELWVAEFEQTSEQDLSWVIPEWIDRAGAPMISLDSVIRSDKRLFPRESIRINISQEGDTRYHLRVPIRCLYEDPTLSTLPPEPNRFDTSLILDGRTSSYELLVPYRVFSVEIDPDYHLFRKLYPQEIEPILSGVLGMPKKRFIADGFSDSARSLFTGFAGSLAEGEAAVEPSNIMAESLKDYAPIILNPSELPEAIATMTTITDTSLVINGVEYTRKGHTFLLAGRDWNGFEKYLVVLSDDLQSLPRIGQLAPHYGKYSYLVFEGAKNVGKGQWPTTGSPLKKTF